MQPRGRRSLIQRCVSQRHQDHGCCHPRSTHRADLEECRILGSVIGFRFELCPLEEVSLWGGEEPTLHWFGLTTAGTACRSASTSCCAAAASVMGGQPASEGPLGEVPVRAGRVRGSPPRRTPSFRFLVDQFQFGERQTGQVHPHAAVPQGEAEGQAGVDVESAARAGDQDFAGRCQGGEQRRRGQRERCLVPPAVRQDPSPLHDRAPAVARTPCAQPRCQSHERGRAAPLQSLIEGGCVFRRVVR
jgi:hypothetical protein